MKRGTSENPIRVAQIGAGYFGRFHINAWERITGAKLVAVAEKSENERNQLIEKYPDLKVYRDVKTLLDNQQVEVIDIATPSSSHADIIRETAPNVECIICQKPFCRNLIEAQKVVAKSSELATKLIIHENFRFQPWYREISKLLASGVLGEVRQASFRFRPGDGNGENAYMERQPYFQTMPRFLVRETAIHWVDVFRFLFGEPRDVYADLWTSNNVIAGEDSGLINFTFDNNLRVGFDGNRTLDHASGNRRLTMGEFQIEGSKATLTLDGNGKIEIRELGSNLSRRHDYQFTDRDFGADCVFHFQSHVISHLTNRTTLETEAGDYLRNREIEEAIYRSNEEGRRVTC